MLFFVVVVALLLWSAQLCLKCTIMYYLYMRVPRVCTVQSLLDAETPCLHKFCCCIGFNKRGDDGHLHEG